MVSRPARTGDRHRRRRAHRRKSDTVSRARHSKRRAQRRHSRGVCLRGDCRAARRRVLRRRSVSVSASTIFVESGAYSGRAARVAPRDGRAISATCSSCTRFGRGSPRSSPQASPLRAGRREHDTSAIVSLIAFGTIAIGGLGCIWGGLAADRRGRERLVMIAMALSGCCALLIPLAFGRQPVAAGRARLGVGVLRHRRFRAIQRARHGVGSASRGRHRAHGANVDGVSADDGLDSAHPAARRRRWMEVGLPDARNWTGTRHRGNPTVGARSTQPRGGVKQSPRIAIALVAVLVLGMARPALRDRLRCSQGCVGARQWIGRFVVRDRLRYAGSRHAAHPHRARGCDRVSRRRVQHRRRGPVHRWCGRSSGGGAGAR